MTFWNVAAIPLVPASIMLLTTYVNAQTIFLLRNEDYFGVDENKLGRVSSLLVVSGFPCAIVGTFTAGYLYDLFGRRPTLFVAFFMGSVCVSLIPWTSPSILPGLMIVRIIFQLFMSAPAANPLLADYIHKTAIGKAATLVGLGFIVGEVLSMAVLFKVTKNLEPPMAFGIVAIVGAVFSCLFLFLVTEPKLRHSAQR